MILGKPKYHLSSDHKWLTCYRNNKKVLARLRARAIKAFEYSIQDYNSLDFRITSISIEIIERYWAAKYPECVITPHIQVYDLSRRGGFGMSCSNLQIAYHLSEKFDLPDRQPEQRMWINKVDIESTLR